MAETTASWWLSADGTWTRHHLDAGGKPLRDLQNYQVEGLRGRAGDG
jgi:polyphosphate kinase